MTVSGSSNNISSYELQEHKAGCLCPNCCKSTANEENNTNSQTYDKTADIDAIQRQELALLQQRDSEVRAHEAAHIAAGGSVISSGASFTYQKGPDGRLYAIGGEVSISSSGGSTPQKKLRISQQIQASALAPASPSPQDLKVASSAVMMELQARQELRQEELVNREKALSAYTENQSFDS